jgi:thiol-disulfide isomerase/thioredoxin
MKSTFLLSLLLGSLYGFAQNEAAPHPLAIESPEMDGYLKSRKPATLTIKADNLPASATSVKINYVVVQLGARMQTKKFTQLNKQGAVTIVLEDNLPYQQVWLTVDGLLYTGIVVNTNLHIDINAAVTKGKEVYLSGEGVRFSGTDGALNTVLNAHILYRKKEQDSIESYYVNRSLAAANRQITLEAFQQTADSAYRQLQAIDDEFIATYPSYGEIIRNETNSMFFGWYCVPFRYNDMPAAMWEKIRAHQPYFVSNDGVAFYQQVCNATINNRHSGPANIQQLLYGQYASYSKVQQSILDSIQYYEQLSGPEKEKTRQELKALYSKRYKHFAGEQTLLIEKRHIKIIDSTGTGPRADLLKVCLMNGLKEQFATTYPVLLSNLGTAWCKKIVRMQLNESIARQKEVDSLFNIAKRLNNDKLYIGKPLVQLPFGANLYRLDSIGNADDFIINLQAKFKEKAIIIDFWATWCGPCLSDLPRSKKLHANNNDLPIEYVYLCTTGGSNEKIWQQYVVDIKAPGTHIFVDDVIITELKRKFNAEGGFPAYVVIDLAGNASASKIHFMGDLDRNKLQDIIGLK